MDNQEVSRINQEQERKSWKDVHEDFAEKDYSNKTCQQKWEEKNFTRQEAKSWIEAGLTPWNYDFVYYLKKDNCQPTDLNEKDLEKLRKKYSWQDIHKDFYFDERKKWEKAGFDAQEAKEFINIGFIPSEALLAKKWKNQGFSLQQIKEWKETFGKNFQPIDCFFYVWLRDTKKSIPQEVNAYNKDEVREEYNALWRSIHEDFGKKAYLSLSKKNYQQKWEKKGFTHEEAKKWINIGFTPDHYKEAKSWKDYGFDSQQAKEWVSDGFSFQESKFAHYLKKNNYSFDTAFQTKSKAQTYLDWQYPKEKRNKETHLDISNKNLRDSLDLSDFINLEVLKCSDNSLTSLDLSNSKKLEELWAFNNNLSEQDLSFVSHLVNLKQLWLGNIDKEKISQGMYNHFTGSLEPLQNMSKLEVLDIRGTDIDSGIEYLSDSIHSLCASSDERHEAKVGKIHDEMLFYGRNLRAWKEAHHPELAKNNLYNEIEMISLPPNNNFTPDELSQIEFKENHNFEKIGYQKVDLRDKRPFFWEVKKTKPLSPEKLPAKLYSVEKDQVEWTKNNPNIKSYAILSYAWGKPGKADSTVWNTQYKDKLNPAGYKSLYKAIQTCKLLGINHLWMDQLCIDQDNPIEKNQEVPKMKQYYGNATATLVSINVINNGIDKIIDEFTQKNNRKEFGLVAKPIRKVINSPWFKRSWTFQEGLLSPQTFFMFDDCLIDGRILAQAWSSVSRQRRTSLDELIKINENPKVFITPFGWTYCKDKDYLESKLNLGLFDALEALKSRERTVSIDGIYSILGLLPYGDQVKPKYKTLLDHYYTKKELEKALLDVMKVAIENGYAAPLTWFGPRKSKTNLWWIPEVDKSGLVNVEGSLNISFEPRSAKFTENHIELVGSKHKLDNSDEFNDFALNANMLNKNTIIWTVDEQDRCDSIFLWGNEETIKRMKNGDTLVIPSKKTWKSNNPFVILVPGEGNLDCPMDLLKIHSVKDFNDQSFQEFLEKKEQNLFIDMVNKEVNELEIFKKKELLEKKQQLENIINRTKGVDQKTIKVLQDNYKQLIHSQQNDDQINAETKQIEIERFKKNFLRDEIPLERFRANMVQKICLLCEVIVQLEWQLEEQTKAQILQNPYISSNFKGGNH